MTWIRAVVLLGVLVLYYTAWESGKSFGSARVASWYGAAIEHLLKLMQADGISSEAQARALAAFLEDSRARRPWDDSYVAYRITHRR